VKKSCHVVHPGICPHYCTNENIINAFGTLKNATTIADLRYAVYSNLDIFLSMILHNVFLKVTPTPTQTADRNRAAPSVQNPSEGPQKLHFHPGQAEEFQVTGLRFQVLSTCNSKLI